MFNVVSASAEPTVSAPRAANATLAPASTLAMLICVPPWGRIGRRFPFDILAPTPSTRWSRPSFAFNSPTVNQECTHGKNVFDANYVCVGRGRGRARRGERASAGADVALSASVADSSGNGRGRRERPPTPPNSADRACGGWRRRRSGGSAENQFAVQEDASFIRQLAQRSVSLAHFRKKQTQGELAHAIVILRHRRQRRRRVRR